MFGNFNKIRCILVFDAFFQIVELALIVTSALLFTLVLYVFLSFVFISFDVTKS